jgi:hypothetical protein
LFGSYQSTGGATVVDGAIVASEPASHAYYDSAFRNHRFRSFELRIDIMPEHARTAASMSSRNSSR